MSRKGALLLLAIMAPSAISFLPSPVCRAPFRQAIRRLKATISSDRQRLDKLLANRGIGSRSEVTKLINQGKVTVNGEVIRSGATKVGASSAKILIEGIEEEIRPPPLLVAYHKPLGVLSTMGDNWHRPNLETLPGKYPVLKNMHPVGRLDADTSGLLLFSGHGDLTQHLLNPSSSIPREYIAVVEGKVIMQDLKEKLAGGIKTTSGVFQAQLLEAEVLPERREVTFISNRIKNDYDSDDYEDDDNDGYTQGIVNRINELADNNNGVGGRNEGVTKLVDCSRIRLSVCEGKYRMVRRILHNSGHSVISLYRSSYGDVKLDSNLTKLGEIRECSEEESQWAKSLLAARQSKLPRKNKYRRKAKD